jgi:hypothetical protein
LDGYSAFDSLWQINEDGTIASTSWLFDKIRPFIDIRSTQTLGSSSFRAGGATYMASAGYALNHIQLLGRWDTQKAFYKYLRNHPYIMQLAMQHAINH